MSDTPDFEAGKWALSITKEDDGAVTVEFYKDAQNVVLLNLGANQINWAAIIDDENLGGSVK